jgi:type II secretory pathway pseudopilin PulG
MITPTIKRKLKSQKGLGLVETLVAVAVLGTAVVVFILSLSTGTLAVNEQDTETIAQNLAQSQMEYTKNYAFSAGASTYPTITAPSGYGITIGVGTASGGDTNIQKITINILKSGANVLSVAGYKVNR